MIQAKISRNFYQTAAKLAKTEQTLDKK